MGATPDAVHRLDNAFERNSKSTPLKTPNSKNSAWGFDRAILKPSSIPIFNRPRLVRTLRTLAKRGERSFTRHDDWIHAGTLGAAAFDIPSALAES
ncbi:hypothetical protein TrST_g12535 [Triparma strigata]|uniref:Uncharacterized protein n=1 Tax=Triparma strigata TaxID=1606541 RepID=A0A9W7B0P7_9STRA|nr:hypothetical protein TrST_g12535 [Triparma strigata]